MYTTPVSHRAIIRELEPDEIVDYIRTHSMTLGDALFACEQWEKLTGKKFYHHDHLGNHPKNTSHESDHVQ